MLPKKYRLAKEKDFQKVFKKGQLFAERFIVLKRTKNNLDFSRFGFVVTLKISKKATERNKIRRQLREAIRSNLSRIGKGFDIVLLLKPEIKGKPYKEIEKALMIALGKAGCYNSKPKI